MAVVNPVADICARARKHGVVTVIDAAQSAGHLPLDVQAIGCDFLAFSSHKICGPTGMGVLYGRRELLEDLPPYQGGGEMISKVEYFHTDYNVPPHRFEAGTPHIEGAVGLHAAMDYLDAIGRDRIFAHDQELAEYCADRLREFDGIRIFGPKKRPRWPREFRSAACPRPRRRHHGGPARSGPARRASLQSTPACQARRPATLRASFYFYNTRDEMDRFIEILRKVCKVLE